MVTSLPHVNVTAGAEVTVKVAVQITGAWQELVTVNVTIELPPQAGGAPALLFVNDELQPPLVVTPASHAA